MINLYFSSASLQDLQYLTIEQSLTDIALLVHTVKSHLVAPDAKVFLWGSGYGGTLAALARQQFPHLIQGAWSSSGLFKSKPFTLGL